MSLPLNQTHENCFYVPKKLSCCHLNCNSTTNGGNWRAGLSKKKKPRAKLMALKGRCHWRISFKAETPWPLFNQHNAAHRYSFGTINFVGWRGGSGQGARAAPRVPEARPGTAEGGAATHRSPHPDRHTGDQTHRQVRDKNMLRPSHTFANMQFKKRRKRSTCPEAKCFRIVSDLLENQKMESDNMKRKNVEDPVAFLNLPEKWMGW